MNTHALTLAFYLENELIQQLLSKKTLNLAGESASYVYFGLGIHLR